MRTANLVATKRGLENIQDSVSAGLVVVDRELRVTRFTAPAVLGAILVVTEVTELSAAQRRVAEALAGRRSQVLEAVLGLGLTGVAQLDGQDRITEVNQAFGAMAGYPPGALVGMPISALISLDADAESERVAPPVGRWALADGGRRGQLTANSGGER